MQTLQNLAIDLAARAAAKKDVVLDTREITMMTTDDQSELHLPGLGEFDVAKECHSQVAARLEIPARFYGKLREGHPALLDHNVNTLLREKPERRLVRLYDGLNGARTARAFLSDRYRRLDDPEVLEAVVPVLMKYPDMQVVKAQITESRMYLMAVTPRVQGEVKKGDIVQAGVIIQNSEIGKGSLSVQPRIFRLVCLNGMISGTATRTYHVGRTLEADQTHGVLSDEAMEAEDKATFLKLRDVTEAALSETTFNALLAQMQEAAATKPMSDPLVGMEILAKKLDLSDGERGGVMGHLISGGDLTAWGALNAVTRTAQDVESFDRGVEMEAMGGKVLAMAGNGEWAAIAG
jgi:hypothetical protein